MSGRRAHLLTGPANRTMLCTLLLLVTLVGASHQQDAARTWDNFSRLIPTNSVYERRDSGGNHPDVSLTRALDENNVMDTSKAEAEGEVEEEEQREEHREEHQEGHESEYEDDYDVESEHREDSGRADNEGKSERLVSGEANNSSSEPDQYDAYYYYDDYDNSSRSRFEAIEDEVDYPEGEEVAEEEEEAREEVSHEQPNAREEAIDSRESRDSIDSRESRDSRDSIDSRESRDSRDSIDSRESRESTDSRDSSEEDKVETQSLPPETVNSTTAKPDLTDEEGEDEEDSLVLRTNQDQEQTSMEGSDKSFSFVGPPSHISDMSDTSILIGEAVVSVVTTKSVVNGTISVPLTTSSPLTTEQVVAPPASSTPREVHQPPISVTTEDSSIILASVQTSRSISGARFLPFPVIDRVEQIDHDGMEARKTSAPPESTESIIDKLDRVQSELSSGILAGGFRTAGNTLQLDVLAQGNRRRYTTTGKTPIISKFVPKRYNDRRLEPSTTPRAKLETTLDSLEGLLPRDYEGRPKTGFRWPTKITTSTTEAPEPRTTTASTTTTKKSKVNAHVQDISAFLPPGYSLKKEDAATESSLLTDILAKSKVDISFLLPAGYDKKKAEQSTPSTTVLSTKGTTSTTTEKPAEKSIQDLFAKTKFDITSLLPRDYNAKSENDSVPEAEKPTVGETSATTTTAATTKKPGGIKLVFPSRPGGRKPVHKITTPHTLRGEASGPVTPRIQKGWPTRATTEFTGWPTPSTTPISIEKLLEAARTATVASVNASQVPITDAVSTTSTTSTTTTTLRPTTPGICDDECEVAGTIRLIGNATWVPELLDRNTQEWQQLANEVEREMNFVFSKSAVLTNWFKKIRIDSFSQGSILVDYFVELAKLEQTVNTQELKVIFHDSLRTYNANRWNETRTKGPMRLGAFMIDPKFTDFVVIPKVATPQQAEKDDRLIPQWAIAVINIAVGNLLFIVVVGVSFLVKRRKLTKLKPAMPTTYNGNASSTQRSTVYSKPVHTIWTDPDDSWNDKSFESTSNKMLVGRTCQVNKEYNLYDSWRSEWNGPYCHPSHTSSNYGGYDTTTNLSGGHHDDDDTSF